MRVGRFGLGKTDRQRDRAGVGKAPAVEEVRARLAHLRGYRWSSYRAYTGALAAPQWLEPGPVLDQGGGAKAERGQNYRQYVESQVKPGRMDSPWEQIQDRVFLGGIDFIAGLKKAARLGRERAETPAWRRERTSIEEIIGAVETTKGERWTDFKNRYGDGGLALALTLARQLSGRPLNELGRKMELEPTVNMSMIIKRYRQRLRKDREEKDCAARAAKMLNATI